MSDKPFYVIRAIVLARNEIFFPSATKLSDLMVKKIKSDQVNGKKEQSIEIHGNWEMTKNLLANMWPLPVIWFAYFIAS